MDKFKLDALRRADWRPGVGRAWSEPALIKLAYAFEQATRVRKAPRFLPRAEMNR